jgi:TPR repeat protein
MRSSTDLPLRHPSASSSSTRPTYSANASRQNSGDDVRTPLPIPEQYDVSSPVDSTGDQQFPSIGQDQEAAPSTYIYSKYALPRGRPVDRTSAEQRTSWINRQFTWDEVKPPPMSPVEEHSPRPREDSNLSAVSAPLRPSSPTGSTGSERISGMRLSRANLSANNSAVRSRSANPDSRSPLRQSSPSVKTESTDRTIRPRTDYSETPTASELTPEQHVDIGVKAHTDGALQKSTYHLRLAAMAGHPTGMLLYALACRHGWGMRPNQEEGVKWLRKAIDGSGLEVIDVEDAVTSATRPTKSSDPGADAAERRKRKAQFALAIYELGISYMNGWGCPKDKPLAVRCYEVAGNWGDCDALAEAGYCYTQGVGCKKDMKKAAALYRKAAEGGMSMAGNSW